MNSSSRTLNDGIERAMYSAMEHAFKDVVDSMSSGTMKESDIDWFVRLCAELRNRLNALTPRRKDLHDQLNNSVDVRLLEQMLKHEAFDHDDFMQLVENIFKRLELLCAPDQDIEIANLKLRILSSSFKDAVYLLVMETNKIIDTIEARLQNL